MFILFIQEPHFSPLDLSPNHPKEFVPGLTDSGICEVYNGSPMLATYGSNARVEEFANLLDPRPDAESKPEMIKGTGKVYEVSFWINLKDT